MVRTRKELLDEIRSMGGVEKVALISRTGMFIDGDNFEESDTFSAMSAIILGAAETASVGVGLVKRVVAHFEDGKKFIVVPAGKKGVLVILASEDVYENLKGIVREFDNLI
ncbi:hypothetical protein AciM339_0954 [Aciduliprofundum sp. MAR08-339]|uniref:roadblock/LC7 domain-containing protein n=1 Tax=Aciduliprofundum sp. (strain MAR08-339) TaxID=673860 RepID=UPI0002A4A4ED|nr:hypothetical protein AciM339_0954 [Aciduliprofundum sp. MAR08-339]